MPTYTGAKGTRYTFGTNEKIAEGGEGIVYRISGNDQIVAKIYKDEHFTTKAMRDTTERKLKAMLRYNISPVVEGKLRLAWPKDILYSNGQMVGFIMPAVNSTTKIYSICRTGKMRLKYHSDFSWKHSVQYAYLLAWVVDYVHRNGAVIGDMNPNNIIVDVKNASIILIDCDSFDITDPVTKEHFPCTVGLPEMLAPEIQGCTTLANAPFSVESDNFSLAIHMFRLLMNNEYPFGGTLLDPESASKSLSNINMNQDILNGECPYVKNCRHKIRDGSPTLLILPKNMQELFRRTFTYTPTTVYSNKKKRASANDWLGVLYPLVTARVGGNELKRCPNGTNGVHIYPAHNASCPWCAIANNTSLKPLNNPAPSKPSPPVQTTTKTSTVNTQKAAGHTGTASTTPKNTQTTASKPTVVRGSGALYFVFILFGIASGFVFEEPVMEFVNSQGILSFEIEIYKYALIVAGIISALFVAFCASDGYSTTKVPFLYFFLGILVFIMPPLILGLLGLAITLIASLLQIILGIIALICFCSMCGGS